MFFIFSSDFLVKQDQHDFIIAKCMDKTLSCLRHCHMHIQSPPF